MSEILVQIVDENDVPLRGATKEEIWQDGLFHRIARVMIEDEQGNILLQKRLPAKSTYPDCWDNSAAGHVDEGESYEVAALRELQEELGISGYPLEEIRYYQTNGVNTGHKLNRFNKLYKAVVPKSVQVTIQKEEVSEVMWVTRSQLASLIEKQPDKIASGLREAFDFCYKS